MLEQPVEKSIDFLIDACGGSRATSSPTFDCSLGQRGYCVLVCRQHVREPYELAPDERAMFFEDMMAAGRALEQVFEPIKMNFQLLGNLLPHLHCHINPRYYGDPWPGAPVGPGGPPVLLTPREYAERVELIRAALR